MNENDTPHLFQSGLQLDLTQLITATAIPEQTRLDEDKQFTNGMMNELLTVCKSMDNNLFFELLKSILPLSVVNNPQFSMDYKHFSGSKLKIFHKSLKKVKKNTSKLVEFYTDEFVFVTRDSPRKKH